ncbi:hypothetical protein ABQ359_22340 [Serratia fonticola]|uniref:hypothetical protein n=1 Tax=Serratia fonticola TaxID=47917 RepID=UPI003AAC02EE
MDKQKENWEQFEKWFYDKYPLKKPSVRKLKLWQAWEASRESLVVEIASHTEFEIEHMISPEKEGYSLGWIDGRNYAARQVEAIGIRIKGEGV